MSHSLPQSAAAVDFDRRSAVAVAAGLLGAFMAILDIQVTNAALAQIVGTLSATQEEGSWITTAYLAAEIIAIPLTGFFSRVGGIRNYFLGTTLAFLLFSTLCANAWDLTSLIVFRALQGFAGGALIPLAMTQVLTLVPPEKRMAALALNGLMTTLAPATGPLLGGHLTELFGWPAIFYVNWLPGVLLLAGVAYGRRPERPQWQLLRGADWPGMVCMAIGLGAATIVLEEGNTHDWLSSEYIASCAALALLGIAGWVLSASMREQPFIDLSLYGKRNFAIASLVSAAMGVGLYGSGFLLTLFLAQIPGYGPLQIGELVMITGLPQLLMVAVVPRLAQRIDNRILCAIGLALFAVSCLMNARIDVTTGHDQLVAAQIVRGVGQPLIMLTLSNFATRGLAPAQLSSGSSLFNMSRNLGGSIGIALLATLLTWREHFHSLRLGESVSSLTPATQARLDLVGQALITNGVEPHAAADMALALLDNSVRRQAYVLAYADCFTAVGALLLIAVVVIWMAERVSAPITAAKPAVAASIEAKR